MQTSSLTTADNSTIYTVSWLPKTPPRAGVVLVHGYGEHIGRYTHVADALYNAGYAVFGLDHWGHGKSDGLRAYVENIDQPVKHLRQYFEQIQQQHPHLKFFMLGHSMGSLITLEFALKYQADLTGLVISGCAVNGDETISPMLEAAARIINRFAPRVPVFPGLPLTELSTDPAVVAAAKADPMMYKGLWRMGTATTIINSGRHIRSVAHEITRPILLVHGEEDKIAPATGSQVMYEKAASADKTLKIYPGMRHEVMNERDKQQVLDDVVTWLNNH